MSNTFFQFKKFRINQDRCAMKVTTDACILGAITPVPKTGHVLDIGTGTGLLALMVAQRSKCTVDAIELDEESFLQAKENVKNSPWADRIKVIHRDVRKFKPRKKYDLIICNPPFFEKPLKSPDERKNVARHGVNLNLKRMAQTVKRLLKPNGIFSALVSEKSGIQCVVAIYAARLHVNGMKMIGDKQSSRHFRFVIQGSFIKMHLPGGNSRISVKDKNENYTPEFIQLMKPFYLHF